MQDRLDLVTVLTEIDRTVTHLFALITDGVAGATDAFLAGDPDSAAHMADRERLIDEQFAAIETVAPRQLAFHSPVSGDLQYLVVVMRIVPELERTGDLIAHIVYHGSTGLASRLTPKLRGLAERAGTVATEMWREVAQCWASPTAGVAERLEARDLELDSLHRAMLDELRAGTVPYDVTVDMAFVCRFLERIGDHAANIARRLEAIPSLAMVQAGLRTEAPSGGPSAQIRPPVT